MDASMLSNWLMERAILRVGSLFPVRYSLTREGETPILRANARCVIASFWHTDGEIGFFVFYHDVRHNL